MKLWDIVVCRMKGNVTNFCGVISIFGRVVVTHAIMSMVIPIHDVCNSRKVKMKSRVKIVITIEFLVEFYTG